MILSAHQPAYLPWLGYFHKIISADVFVFLDAVQFEKNGFINRNKIKTQNGPLWLTIPVLSKGHLDSTMLEMQMSSGEDWKSKHLKSIEYAYKKAPHFDELFLKIQKLFDESPSELLSDFCFFQLQFWMKELNITTPIVKLSELKIKEKKSDLILEVCKKLKADIYLSGVQGANYLDEASFEKELIQVFYQEFKHPVYPQLHGDFIPQLSIVDFLMNTKGADEFFNLKQKFENFNKRVAER